MANDWIDQRFEITRLIFPFLIRSVPPVIWIPMQLVGAPPRSNVTLDCHSEAYPPAVNYWAKEGHKIFLNNDKFVVSVRKGGYKTHMQLTVRQLREHDFGAYKCLSENLLGSTEGSVKLYGELAVHIIASFAEEGASCIRFYVSERVISVPRMRVDACSVTAKGQVQGASETENCCTYEALVAEPATANETGTVVFGGSHNS